MNHGIPSLEACRRLAKVWSPSDSDSWWRIQSPEGPEVWSHAEEFGQSEYGREPPHCEEDVAAPTIGEMLDYIRRRGPSFRSAVAHALAVQLRVREERSVPDCFATFLTYIGPNELANALAEVIEKENEEPVPGGE